jgi:hypothetical protein
VWVLINHLIGLYDRDVTLGDMPLYGLPRIALSIVLGASLVYVVAPPVAGFEPARPQTAAFAGFALLTVSLLRGAVRAFLARPYPPEPCVLIGSGLVADLVARDIAVRAENGVKLVEFVDVPHVDHRNGASNGLQLEELERLEEVCRDFRVKRIVIAF